MLFLTIGLFASSTLGWLWYAEKRNTADRRSSLDLLWMEQLITNELGTHQVMLQNWALDYEVESQKSHDEFLRRIDDLIKNDRAILAIEIVDRSQQRVIGLPEYQQRPAKLPPLNDPLVVDAIERSRALEDGAYSHVIEQFAPLWVLALPTTNEQIRGGSILVTYDLDKLLTEAVPWWFVQRYDLSLVDKNDKQLWPNEGGLIMHGKKMSRLDFGPVNSGLSLKTSVREAQDFDHLLYALATAVILFGLLIMWLLRLLRQWLKERHAAKKALRERDELIQHTAKLSSLAEFASGMAHELNQPLAAIANYAAAAESLLEREQLTSPKIREALEKMGEESRRAGKIMRSMRNFIQKNASLHEPYSLPKLINESIELIAGRARQQHIAIQFNSDMEDLVIECDSIMLKQVLFNLMRNALEAMETVDRSQIESAILNIDLVQSDNYVTVSVVDQGHGISELPKLFQAFYTTKSEGMGLGLAICRTVIENHGGKIWAENLAIGGAAFRFRLPLSPLAPIPKASVSTSRISENERENESQVPLPDGMHDRLQV
ncbi:sensor histidine kinase [Undibacterium fentianense]|uniref:histidine kinase n=1 Tax=Undibacterium fentianense TaxID=2828728 RepID=A0A941E0T4_9BURK|nr:ATP-binding protein [Undibacterium fentianense]MBR7800270.1 GHKL domain-containing protein [Undibacterium fentianense]